MDKSDSIFFVGQLLYSTENVTYSIKKVGRIYLTIQHHSGPKNDYQDLRVVKSTMTLEYTGYGSKNPAKFYTDKRERDIEIRLIKKRSILESLIHSLPYVNQWHILSEEEIDTLFSIICKISQINDKLNDKIEKVYGGKKL